MADESRQELKRLLLAYESLADEKQRRVRELLDRYPDLDLEWRKLQAIEKSAQDPVPVDEDAIWAEIPLSPFESKAERVSHAELLASCGVSRTSSDESSAEPWWRWWTGPRWGLLVPVTAALILLIVIPQLTDDQNILRDLTINTLELADDGSRSGSAEILSDNVLRSGQAFALDFSLAADSYVLIYHVDPAGAVELVFPSREPGALARFAGNRRYTIPSLESGENWILGGDSGAESFVVATWSDGEPDMDQLGCDVDLLTRSEGDREHVVDRLLDLLGETVNQVEVIDIQHVE